MHVNLPSSPQLTSEDLCEQARAVAEMHAALQADLKKAADAQGLLAVIESRARAVADAERLLAYRIEIVERRERAAERVAVEQSAFATLLQQRSTSLGEEIREHAARVAAQPKDPQP